VRSGIARYSVELLPGLSGHYQIDVFVDRPPGSGAPEPVPGVTVHNAHDFLWLHLKQPYDLIVYQLGNARCHDYMWGYLARFPGLVVMHDGQFHHARATLLREQGRYDDYQREFSYSHPDLAQSVRELGVSGRLGRLYFLWPLRRVVVASARMLVVHNEWLARELQEQHPDARVRTIEMGVPPATPAPDARASVRAHHDIPDGAVVFLALGAATPEKRLSIVVQQLAAMAQTVPHARLLIAGSPVSHFDVMAEASALGVADRVTFAGFLPHEAIDRYIAAADVCLCLRWPTSRETSAAWLRCLAVGRPTIITDLVHLADIPAYDPRGWRILHTRAARVDDLGFPVRNEPACVAIDLLDERHSLGLAMHRLATDPGLRTRLGRQAQALWSARFALGGMVEAYRAAIDDALLVPPPSNEQRATLPSHFRRDGTEFASELMRDMGLDEAGIASVWRVGVAP
jgi:glycosyltransferase involved in cell wall biosynthesis